MNNKSHSLQKPKQKRLRHFYSILEQPHTNEHQQGDELSKLLRKGKQLLYIDINEQKGFKLMQPCETKLVEEDSLQLGQNFITNLQNLSTGSAKTASLMLQLKQDINKKERTSLLMAQEVKKKRDKLKQIGSLIVKREKTMSPLVKPLVYRGMPSELIQNLMLSRQHEQMESQIKKRQNVLLQHYSTITTEGNHKQPQPSVRQKSTKNKDFLLDFKRLNKR